MFFYFTCLISILVIATVIVSVINNIKDGDELLKGVQVTLYEVGSTTPVTLSTAHKHEGNSITGTGFQTYQNLLDGIGYQKYSISIDIFFLHIYGKRQ
mgnify:CR=1 FL=1